MGEGIFAVVPSSLLNDGNAAVFLPSVLVCSSELRVSCHQISDTLSLVSDCSKWPDSCVCHEIEPMLVDCLKSDDDAIHASSFDNRLYIAVMKNGQLLLANCFIVNCNEDTLYHLLAAYKAYNLDRLRHPLRIHGKMDTIFLKNYIGKISLCV